MMRIVRATIALSALGLPMAANGTAQIDLRDYALASCLTKQTASPALQAEGYRLAEIVLARAGVSPLAWKSVAVAVDAALARRGMLITHVDGPVAQATRPAPLASCLVAIESPSVRRAILARIGKL